MDELGPTASMILVVCLLVIDVLFFGLGEALKGVNNREIERKAEENGDKRSRRLRKILEKPAVFVNTLQMTVTAFHLLVGAVLAESLAALAILFFVILTFGVLMPKKLAARKPDKWAYAAIVPVHYIMMVLWPFTWLVDRVVRVVLWIFGIRKEVEPDDVTEEEILDMVNEGQEQGVLQASEAEMINNIIELDDKEAQDIMTHRNNIIAIDGQMLLTEALQFMLDSNNSRYPVYEENIDHIIGIIHLKDAMRLQTQEHFTDKPICELYGAIREAKFIPATRNINELFKEMQSEKIQMVIVVDEYGQTGGLIAMEDILEEIVGNIMDEYDEDMDYIEEKSEDEYVIEGKTPLEELEEKLDISFEEEGFETINGFLISKLERIPEKEDENFAVDYEDYTFKILKVENKMIQSVLVTKVPDKDGEEAQTEPEE